MATEKIKTPKNPAAPPDVPVSPTMRIPIRNVVIDYAFNVRSKTEKPMMLDKDGKLVENPDPKAPKVFRGVNELAADIKTNGQLSPVHVRPLEDGKYFLIAGFRRVDALKSLDAEFVDAKIEAGDDLRAYLLNVKENVNRDDLTTYDLAMRCKLLRDKFKLEAVNIAKELAAGRDYKGEGMSAGYIRNLIRAADGLHPKILDDWRVSKIPTDKVVKWAAMDPDEQVNEWEDWRGGKEGEAKEKGEGKASGPSGKKIKRASEALLKDAIKAVDGHLKLGESVKDSMLAVLQFALGKTKVLRYGQTVVYDPKEAKKAAAEAKKTAKEDTE